MSRSMRLWRRLFFYLRRDQFDRGHFQPGCHFHHFPRRHGIKAPRHDGLPNAIIPRRVEIRSNVGHVVSLESTEQLRNYLLRSN